MENGVKLENDPSHQATSSHLDSVKRGRDAHVVVCFEPIFPVCSTKRLLK